MKWIIPTRLVAAVGGSVIREKFYLEPGVYVSDDQLPGDHNITVAVAEDQTLQLRVDAEYEVLESPKLESYPVNGGYRGLAQESNNNALFGGFCIKLGNLLGVSVVMDSFKLWLREDHFSLEIGGKEYRFPLKETSALRTHAGGAKGVGDSASLKRKAVGDEAPEFSPKFTRVQLDSLLGQLQTFTPVVGNYSGSYTDGCHVGVNLEVVGILEAKLQLKPSADQQASSTGVMKLKRETTSANSCYIVDEYTVEDAAMFDHVAKATKFRFVASPSSFRICPLSGYALEILINGGKVELHCSPTLL
ncbi:hypothetical protein FOZ60_014084 [Perkinsus olseni]|uniref:Uncharacterized protein n=1 Tax=Perkinsus olseni TaxID=32597 RepID=A0A7J6P8Y2_PEROL|nr:hypothetical protein FOZ60_014084 [Perkinsus olseni]